MRIQKKRVRELIEQEKQKVAPETILSYNNILKNLPETNSLPSTWTPLESSAHLLFNENALTINEEIMFCNSGKSTGNTINRFGKSK